MVLCSVYDPSSVVPRYYHTSASGTGGAGGDDMLCAIAYVHNTAVVI